MTEINTVKNSCCRISPWLMMSAAANLFLVGVVVAPLLHSPHGAHFGDGFPPRDSMQHGALERGAPPPPNPRMIIDHLAQDMSADDAKLFRTIYEQEDGRLQAGHEQMRDSFIKLGQLLRTEKPDMDALKATLETIHAGHGQMHDTMSGVIQRVATDLSLDGRRKVADFLEHMPK
jgi:hypothetical protein